MIKIVCYWSTLFRYAKEQGLAERSGDKDRFEKAKAKHEEYRQLCLRADEVR